VKVKKPESPVSYNPKLQLIARRRIERERDDEMIRRYIHSREFDMEYRYDYDYRKEWSEKSGIPLSRFNDSLDRIIEEAWRNIRNGKVKTETPDEG
jgi:hypothetical protein